MKSPREKVNVKKWNCYALRWKKKRHLDIRAHFWPHFFAFWDLFGHNGSGTKNAYFLRIRFQNRFVTLEKKVVLETIYLFYILPKFSYYVSTLTKNSNFGQKWTSKAVFTIGVPVKNAFLVVSRHFTNVIILLKQFYRAHTKFWSMTMNSELGQHKPKYINDDFWALE